MLFQQSSCTVDGEFNDLPFYSCDNRFNYIFVGTDSNWLISIGSDPRKSEEYRIVSKSPFHHVTSDSCPPVFTEWSNGLFLSCADYKTTQMNKIRKGCLLLRIHNLCFTRYQGSYIVLSLVKGILTGKNVAGPVI